MSLSYSSQFVSNERRITHAVLSTFPQSFPSLALAPTLCSDFLNLASAVQFLCETQNQNSRHYKGIPLQKCSTYSQSDLSFELHNVHIAYGSQVNNTLELGNQDSGEVNGKKAVTGIHMDLTWHRLESCGPTPNPLFPGTWLGISQQPGIDVWPSD